MVVDPEGHTAGCLLLLAVAAAALLTGCGGTVEGTPSELVHGAAQRTLDAGSAKLEQSAPGVTRAGEVEFRSGRARIVEHGRYGYGEYRYLGGAAWFQLGGDIGSFGEDLGGKWVRHPRADATDDVLAELEQDVRSLARATQVRRLGGRAYSAVLNGTPATLHLDSHGRLVELHLGRLMVALSHFGEPVQVDAPPADGLYVGHD